MKLFFYYIFHSFINQIRKMFKTWVLIFILICAVMGGVIGFGVASLTNSYEEGHPDTIEEIEEWEEDEQEISLLESIDPSLNGDNVMEAIIMVTIIGIILFEVYQSDQSGSKIFIPADANLLFASPMKPQSVLLFRLLTHMGTILTLLLYYALIFPSSFGFNTIQGLVLASALILAFIVGKLIQIFIYSYGSTHPRIKKNAHYIVFAIVIVLVGLYVSLYGTEGNHIVNLVEMFSAPITNWIPVVGWIKGFALALLHSQYLLAIVLFALSLAVIMVMGYFIWHIEADFYEEALQKTEELAEALQIAQKTDMSGFMKRKKDRKDSIPHDVITRGSGASVIFYKSLANRFRFAKLKIFTKTAITYLFTAILVGLFGRFVIQDNNVGFLITIFVLASFIFFRTLADNLQEDTSKTFFRMIPESTEKKLWYSICSSLMNCTLDLIPGFIVAALLNFTDIWVILGSFVFLTSMYFYGMIVNSFIALSLPENMSKEIRQIIVVFFMYFGLLPDILILAINGINDAIYLGLFYSTIVNIAIGIFFYAMMPVFLEPRTILPYHAQPLTKQEKKVYRKPFSRVGFSLLGMLVLTFISQFIMLNIIPFDRIPYGEWLLTFIPMYCIGLPGLIFIIRGIPSYPLEKKSVSWKQMLMGVAMTIGVMYFSNLIGTLIINFILNFVPASSDTTQNVTSLIAESNTWVKFAMVVVIGPLIEEIIFRKLFIDKLHVYGAKTAIILSGVLFGLFHENMSQFFYATTIGILFGCIYYKTGKLRYTYILHMIMNFLGSIVSVWLMEGVDLQAVLQLGSLYESGLYRLLIYVLAQIVIGFIGIVFVVRESHKLQFPIESKQIPRGQAWSISVWNIGIILFILITAFTTITSIL